MLRLVETKTAEELCLRDYDPFRYDRILSCIKKYGPISRQEISKYCRIPYVTVEKLVLEMVKSGKVRDLEDNLDGLRGRPPRVLVLRNS